MSDQQTKTIADLWDGAQLRCSFRRTFSADLMMQWQEILAIAGSIVLTDEEDHMNLEGFTLLVPCMPWLILEGSSRSFCLLFGS